MRLRWGSARLPSAHPLPLRVASSPYLLSVGARQEDDRDADDILARQLVRVRGLGLEHEPVSPGVHGAHERGVEHLIVLFALSGTHVNELPLQIFFEVVQALVLDLELEVASERRRIVQNRDVGDVDGRHGVRIEAEAPVYSPPQLSINDGASHTLGLARQRCP